MGRHISVNERIPDDGRWVIEPCGCGHGLIDDAFVIEPCSGLCPFYREVATMAKQAHGRPPTYLHVGNVRQ